MKGNHSNMKKTVWLVLALAICLVPHAAFAADLPELARWTRTSDFADRDEAQRVKVSVVYYSNEYVEALVKAEAEKNLWTRDETENYKYTLLKTLNFHDAIAFQLTLYVEGLPMYAQPFDRHISLWIGNKRYNPTDYDKRFNVKILGERDGMIWFPRYDPKTGAELLKGAKDIRLVLDGAISQAISPRGDAMWVWDITKDVEGALGNGKAMDRLELDRLIKRLEKLNQERGALQLQVDSIDQELNKVNSRIDELQGR